ncbi:MAG TPA: PD-(D/E)XK nuclease family protein [Tenuifilaceae bacterium]|nr:PD-(D/E)XK nuclease family protein [Tenuifilaceae bacterium]
MQNEFNIFKFLRIEEKEVIASQFIVSVMKENPEFTKLFLQKIGCYEYFDEEELKAGIKIQVEKNLKSKSTKKLYGKADIWIRSKAKGSPKRIIIENKLFADDQWRQLRRYREYLDEEGANRVGKLYYLTIEGKPPSIGSIKKSKDNKIMKSSDENIGCARLSYGEHIILWLKNVQSILTEEKNVQFVDVINQFLKVIERHSRVFIEVLNNISGAQNDSIKFKVALELHFWNTLADMIEKDNFNIDSRRRYSYDKILNNHKNNSVKKRYGLILGDKRIYTGDSKESHSLFFNIGGFNETTWVGNEPLKIEVKLDALTCKNNAEEIAKIAFNLYCTM